MNRMALKRFVTWAEDRAMLKSNPSADLGAKIGDGAANRRPTPFSNPLRDWHQSVKLSRHDVATSSTRCRIQLANPVRTEFQFPLNQNSWACSS